MVTKTVEHAVDYFLVLLAKLQLITDDTERVIHLSDIQRFIKRKFRAQHGNYYL